MYTHTHTDTLSLSISFLEGCCSRISWWCKIRKGVSLLWHRSSYHFSIVSCLQCLKRTQRYWHPTPPTPSLLIHTRFFSRKIVCMRPSNRWHIYIKKKKKKGGGRILCMRAPDEREVRGSHLLEWLWGIYTQLLFFTRPLLIYPPPLIFFCCCPIRKWMGDGGDSDANQ